MNRFIELIRQEVGDQSVKMYKITLLIMFQLSNKTNLVVSL